MQGARCDDADRSWLYVLDFMSLNEKAVTLEKIFEFFKSKNTSWMKIRTFVIDKHVVEWRVLEECFPSAKVLLSQFHAIMYWKKLGELGSAWWLRTKTQFNATLQRCCIGITDVIELQHRYWRNSDVYIAYLLAFLFLPSSERTRSSKTAVDQTVASVLTHQATITRPLLQSLHRHNCRSRNPDTVPVFLRQAAGLLSDYVLGKVRQQWDLSWTLRAKSATAKLGCGTWLQMARCTRAIILSGLSNATVSPCDVVCRNGHDFEELPSMTISSRWRMAEATKLYRQLEDGAASIDAVTSSIKLKHAQVKHRKRRYRHKGGATFEGSSGLVLLRVEKVEMW
ncbi:hypothetical protein GQ600_18046 [Phytophthora cactorum]|nr:hypothetical protein GQ600_18046 [Phytophthora cactorum]